MAETQEQYLAKLELAIDQANKAKLLEEDGNWKLVSEILQSEMGSSMERISGDTFVRDHEGYLNELGKLQALRAIFNRLNVAKRAGQVAAEKKEQFEKDVKSSEPKKS